MPKTLTQKQFIPESLFSTNEQTYFSLERSLIAFNDSLKISKQS
jgi:hypothetical protein